MTIRVPVIYIQYYETQMPFTAICTHIRHKTSVADTGHQVRGAIYMFHIFSGNFQQQLRKSESCIKKATIMNVDNYLQWFYWF